MQRSEAPVQLSARGFIPRRTGVPETLKISVRFYFVILPDLKKPIQAGGTGKHVFQEQIPLTDRVQQNNDMQKQKNKTHFSYLNQLSIKKDYHFIKNKENQKLTNSALGFITFHFRDRLHYLRITNCLHH
ncbi:hypothetical protein [Desulfonema ishimotonii]|uniref:hypothetical protein n=1 Tax=Desulfonema ishimotonii TaxID=45657 RepID=UPI000F58B368|nr:hypothetical protein [Desulfonema ishimotonii]